MKTIIELEKKIVKFKGWKHTRLSESQVKEVNKSLRHCEFQSKLEQTKEIYKMIEEHIVEDDYMSIDTKQSFKELLSKIKGLVPDERGNSE